MDIDKNVIAHKLRGPFSVIYTSADMLLNGLLGDLTKEQQDIMQRVLLQAEQGLKIIDEVFTDGN